jgi:hypothetical protein
VKLCRVFYRDRAGVEHSVLVEAVNRYHAFALALVKMGRCSWSNTDYSGVEQLTVQVLEGANRRVLVTREHFEAWLGPPLPLMTDKLKESIMMLLKRIPPSRDFKAGRSRH